ncbi:hypothetical protein D6S56_17490, partial [Salmonella enterica subsp. enterica serovar Napoli]|nr:hypothetical protein [Salmonella enterica subsp. enterica serovar Napoli]
GFLFIAVCCLAGLRIQSERGVMTGIIVLSSLPVYKRMLLVRCLVPPGDDNQLTITADYYFHPQHEGPLCLFNCAACA